MSLLPPPSSPSPPRHGLEDGTAISFDLCGPSFLARVKRTPEGHIESVRGINMTLGYTWKNYWQPSKQLSMYHSFGTLALVVPHAEIGIDWRSSMVPTGAPSIVVGAGLTYGIIPKFHFGIYG